MKELSFEKMEEVNGGSVLGCLAAGVSGSGTLVTIAMFAAGISAGPAGWIAIGFAVTSLGLTLADGDPCES